MTEGVTIEQYKVQRQIGRCLLRGSLQYLWALRLARGVIGSAASVNDVTEGAALLHGEEKVQFADAGYRGIDKREDAKDLDVTWRVAMQLGKRRALNPKSKRDQLLETAEKLKASVRAKVEHPFRAIKQQFGYAKVRYRGLAKNTARLTMLFAMRNLWTARKQFKGAQG